MRKDTSTGQDQIPAKYLVPVADEITSVLTHIINVAIDSKTFPDQWKLARVAPIPKTNNPTSISELRPISILPIMSKIFEKIILQQMASFIDAQDLYKSKMSGFRKGHSTTTLLLKLKSDIVTALKKGEVSLLLLADYSKAFDTVDYRVVTKKLSKLGFSSDFLELLLSYLFDRKQLVRIDDRVSNTLPVNFGVPQGSILGPVIFNLYVTDLDERISSTVYQYADDTSILNSKKLVDIPAAERQINSDVASLTSWSRENGLVLNDRKTKIMMFSTSQLSKRHKLANKQLDVSIDDTPIERVKQYKILGTVFDENLTWDNQIAEILKSCHAVLKTLRKVRRIADYKLRKQLVQSLVLSKLDFNNAVYFPLTQKQLSRLQKIMNCACSFVNSRYCRTDDVVKMGWLPVKQRQELSLLISAHNSVFNENYPSYLQLELKRSTRVLRNATDTTIRFSVNSSNYEDLAARAFNSLPEDVRSLKQPWAFKKAAKRILLQRVIS